MNFRLILVLLAFGYFGWSEFLRPPVTLQSAQSKGYSVTELEDYSETVRILSTEAYRYDRESEIAPMDLAVGWGPVTESAVYEKFDISQSGRWFHWTTDNFPIPRRDFETHASNIHIVPANAQVAAQLKKLKREDLVVISGALVEVEGSDGWKWKSSLSREDTGDGACELLLLKEIRYLN